MSAAEWKLPDATWRLRVLAIAVLAVGSCIPACSFLAPGLDTRTALEQKQTTSYDASGNFITQESTTHNRRNAVIEGDSVAMEFYEDGTPKLISGASSVMTQNSDPYDAATAYMHLAVENAKVVGRLMDTLDRVLPGLIQRMERIETAAKAEVKPKTEN